MPLTSRAQTLSHRVRPPALSESISGVPLYVCLVCYNTATYEFLGLLLFVRPLQYHHELILSAQSDKTYIVISALLQACRLAL